MRGTSINLLSSLLNAADKWRADVATAGGELNGVDVQFPNGENIELNWKQEFGTVEQSDGTQTTEVVWEGWDVKTHAT